MAGELEEGFGCTGKGLIIALVLVVIVFGLLAGMCGLRVF